MVETPSLTVVGGVNDRAYGQPDRLGPLIAAIDGDARADGIRTATLQASPDGRGVYERLGFRTVATLHASVAGRP